MRLPNDKIAIIPDLPQEITNSGIFIPESAQTPTYTGTVLVVGDKVKGKYKTGDHILYQYKSGYDLEYEGKKIILVPEANVFAKDNSIS